MKRRNFLNRAAGAAAGTLGGLALSGEPLSSDSGESRRKDPQIYPLAITMWEFSWLERRWPGAGYEDWDRVLSELVERGYDAIRIDAFPHLIYEDPGREYTLLPVWSTQDWGSPEINRVQVQPHLNQFLERCRAHHVRVGLSSWFRTDTEDLRMKLTTAQKLGEAWLAVLRSIGEGGLLDTILYVDLCNEWTGDAWCPFFVNDPPEALWTGWDTGKSKQWMRDSIAVLREYYPGIPYTFSFTGEITRATLSRGPFEMLDFLEPHIWMSGYNGDEFYKKVGYNYERFDYGGYRNMALHGRQVYEAQKEYWQQGLREQIRLAANWSEQLAMPLITTECWGVVDYKDFPLLDWGYVRELCALGTLEAAKTGRWLAMATSNFCGPQFVGMWRDVAWHRTLTDAIHAAPVAGDLQDSKLAGHMLRMSRQEAGR
jgi:hypothetical protein